MAKRILLISPTPTHPTNAGNRIRIVRLVEALHELGHEVHVLVAPREQNDPAAMAAWLGERLHLISYRRPARVEALIPKLIRWGRQSVDPDARYTWGIDDWYDPGLDVEIDRLHLSHRFDAVIVEYVFFSRALERFGSEVLKVVDTHDRFSLRHRLYLEIGLPPQFFSCTEEEEARGLNRADLVLAIQDTERAFFSRICHKEVITVGHFVTVEPQFEPDRLQDGFNILFVGSANPINLDGIRAFVAQVWPLLRQRIPSAQLLLAGGVCNAEAGGDSIVRLGFVDDVRSAYRQAHVVINPVRQGTGLNIKSIEALGYGMPLVSSSAGARGLESAHGRALLIADTPGEVVAAMERIRSEGDMRRNLSAQALAFAATWNTNALGRLAIMLR